MTSPVCSGSPPHCPSGHGVSVGGLQDDTTSRKIEHELKRYQQTRSQIKDSEIRRSIRKLKFLELANQLLVFLINAYCLEGW